MTKESEENLVRRLHDTEAQVTVGARYRHYKQNYYTVTGVALLESNNGPCVIYQAEHGEKLTFIRPLDDWMAVVDYGDAQVKRFTKV